jgi:tetratricopeptide (TPR) repeat protein
LSLSTQLTELESAGLIRLARAEPDLEYLFRHALVQDAAYESLLKAERHTLHRSVGEVLEDLYANRLEELAPRLAEHFWQAGDAERALNYFRMAAENAARGYANAEAIDLYTRALGAAGPDQPARIPLLQARGSLYDILGDFERALSDQEAAHAAAQENADLKAQWQSLVNLGYLWSSRDYHKTGDYYREAIALARQLEDRRLLAHSLNWLANFQINSDDPQASHANHFEALGIFEDLGDEAGIAETSDLLGMSLTLSADLFGAVETLDRAQDLYRKINQPRGVVSVLATRALGSANRQTETMVHPGLRAGEAIEMAKRGADQAAEIGWPSGVIFCLSILCFCQVEHGEFGAALETSARSVAIAGEIQHRQWEIITNAVSGLANAEIFQLERARMHYGYALGLAEEMHSGHWTHSMAADLAACLIATDDLDEAAKLLDRYLPPSSSFDTGGQRLAWCSRASLAIRQGNPDQALEIVDRLVAATPRLVSGSVLILPGMIRAEAFTRRALREDDAQTHRRDLEAGERSLREVLDEVNRLDSRAKTWRIHLLLAENLAAQGKAAEAAAESAHAHQSVLELGNTLSDPGLRKHFIEIGMKE